MRIKLRIADCLLRTGLRTEDWGPGIERHALDVVMLALEHGSGHESIAELGGDASRHPRPCQQTAFAGAPRRLEDFARLSRAPGTGESTASLIHI
jgi:hypothetical protein